MKLPRRAARVPQALPSERGFLEIAGRDDGISLREAFLRFRDLVSADMDWADSRKLRFRLRAACVKVAALALTAASTVVLGIPAIPGRAAIALPMVALVTLISALEPFFNWRARWVLMEETQYRLNRIRDEMDYYLVTTPAADLDRDRLRAFFTDQQDIWQDVSRQWIEFRKQDQSQPGGTPPLDTSPRLQPDGRRSSSNESDKDPPFWAELGISRFLMLRRTELGDLRLSGHATRVISNTARMMRATGDNPRRLSHPDSREISEGIVESECQRPCKCQDYQCCPQECQSCSSISGLSASDLDCIILTYGSDAGGRRSQLKQPGRARLLSVPQHSGFGIICRLLAAAG